MSRRRIVSIRGLTSCHPACVLALTHVQSLTPLADICVLLLQSTVHVVERTSGRQSPERSGGYYTATQHIIKNPPHNIDKIKFALALPSVLFGRQGSRGFYPPRPQEGRPKPGSRSVAAIKVTWRLKCVSHMHAHAATHPCDLPRSGVRSPLSRAWDTLTTPLSHGTGTLTTPLSRATYTLTTSRLSADNLSPIGFSSDGVRPGQPPSPTPAVPNVTGTKDVATGRCKHESENKILLTLNPETSET
ncbi:hypothetical protein Bbelb_353510 [Branchiostoma belcheri]|nr:hypothetical protein Bbelb_353510 [Branchiostoma belcheri]